MDLVRLVDSSLATPKSHLPEAVLEIKGHGSARVSHFFNNLCSMIPGCRYLEFGTFTGRSLVSASWGNAGVYRGVDKLQWLGSSVRFESVEALKSQLARNLSLAQGSDVGVTEADFRLYTPEQPAYDVFFYDADHGYEATRDGILMMLPYLKPGVLIVDDYLTHSKATLVQQGTVDALAQANVLKSWTLTPKNGWHTGLFVAVVG